MIDTGLGTNHRRKQKKGKKKKAQDDLATKRNGVNKEKENVRESVRGLPTALTTNKGKHVGRGNNSQDITNKKNKN